METTIENDEVVTIKCECGCNQTIALKASLLDNFATGKVKEEYRPSGYCSQKEGFVVSGETRYIYASIECLNSMNE